MQMEACLFLGRGGSSAFSLKVAEIVKIIVATPHTCKRDNTVFGTQKFGFLVAMP